MGYARHVFARYVLITEDDFTMETAMNTKGEIKKPFCERLLELAGFKIWPPTHNDPRIKGPQPRILTKRQWEAMEKMCREREGWQDGNIQE